MAWGSVFGWRVWLGLRLGLLLVVGVGAVGVSSGGVGAQSAGISGAERDALVALYDATGGDNWTNKSGWKTDMPVHEWYGIDDSLGLGMPFQSRVAERRVYGVVLKSNNLVGTLPDLSGLSRLRVLDLYDNKLSGDLPASLGGLPYIKVVSLGKNEFSGEMPEEWGFDGGAGDIQTIDLTGNRLIGIEFGLWDRLTGTDAGDVPWQSLRYLLLGGNRMTSALPQWVTRLPALEVLDLSGQGFNGRPPWQYADMGSLRELYLQGNRLSGLISPTWGEAGKFGSLEVLRLDGNELTDETAVPLIVENLPKLRILRLEGNSVGEGKMLSDKLGESDSIEVLRLDGNGYSGGLPAAFGSNGTLRVLGLSGNMLDGVIPADLSGMTALEELRLDNNMLSGELPVGLTTLPAIRKLMLHRNGFSGDVPGAYEDFNRMRSLEHLTLDHNMLTGNVHIRLTLVTMRKLSVTHNEFTGFNQADLPVERNQILDELLLEGNGFVRIPGNLKSHINLERLSLNNNMIEGEVPSDFGELSRRLRDLYLDGNMISGAFPSHLGQLRDLEELHLQNNMISGGMTSGLGSLQMLEELYLHGNDLSGEWGTELAGIASLRVLNLSHNGLTGEIGSGSLRGLSGLEELYLNDNMFTGAVPAALGNVDSLRVLWVGNNRFDCIPAGLTDGTPVVDEHGLGECP